MISDNVLKTRAILFAADNLHGGLMISPEIITDIELSCFMPGSAHQPAELSAAKLHAWGGDLRSWGAVLDYELLG